MRLRTAGCDAELAGDEVAESLAQMETFAEDWTPDGTSR